jgi:hypothetical protein
MPLVLPEPMASSIDACTRLVGAVDSAGVSKRPPPPAEPPTPRNGVDDVDDQDEEEPRETDWFDRASELCSKVPPGRLRSAAASTARRTSTEMLDRVARVSSRCVSDTGRGSRR